jgi:ABC-type uncharacterized transport system substrate-binding protein
MKYVGMFINLAESDSGEVTLRKNSFWSGVTSVYSNATLLPLVYGAGVYHTYQTLADQLVQSSPSPPDTVYFAPCGPSLWALQLAAGKNAPIVCGAVCDPYGSGETIDGYKVSGTIAFDFPVSAKYLKALNAAYQGITQAGVIWDPQMRAGVAQYAVVSAAASAMNIGVTGISVRQDIAAAIKAFATPHDPTKGIVVLTSTYTATQRGSIIQAVNQCGLSAIYPDALYVRSGGKLSYGPPTIELYKQAGVCVGQILNNQSCGWQTNTGFEWYPDPITLGLNVSGLP